MNQAIMGAIGHLGDSDGDARTAIYDGISFEEKEEVNKVFEVAKEWADSDNKREQVRKKSIYIESLGRWQS